MTATKPTAATRPADAKRLLNQTVVLELHIKTPTFRAAVPPKAIMDDEDKADATLFHVNKQLINREALLAIRSHRNTFINWLFARRVPCGVLAGGMHLVPLRLVEEIDAELATFKQKRAELVEELLGKYDELVAEARQRLAGHFNPDDYPDVAELRGAFGVQARFLSLNVPAALEQVNRELYERESARVQAEWAEAAGEVRAALREGFAKLVANLAERLTPGEDGKPKTFHSSTVENLSEFLSMFRDRDITNDTELSALVKQAKGLLAGSDPKVLRTQETTRERVLTGFTEITKQLNTMGVTVLSRRVAASDDDV